MNAGELELNWWTRRQESAVDFESFVRRHERLILRTAWRMLGSLEEAQDTAQDVFLKLFSGFASLGPEREAPSWIYRVTMNACYDRLRRRPPEAVELDEVTLPSRDCPARDLLEAERRDLLARALLRLPEKERAAIVLRDLEGLETRTVAEILGSTETTVRSQISTGKARLRKLLEGVGL